jgi:hypothetical protein
MNRNIKRLIRQADDSLNKIYKNTFLELGKEGREILRSLDEYRYKVSKSKGIINNDEKMAKKLEECIEDLNHVSAYIYDFVFELENYEIVDETDSAKQLEFSKPEKPEFSEDDEVSENETTDETEESEETDNTEETNDEVTDEVENSMPDTSATEDKEEISQEDLDALFDGVE